MAQVKSHNKSEEVAAGAAAPFANGDAPEVILDAAKDKEAPASPLTPQAKEIGEYKRTSVVIVSKPGKEKETELTLRSFVAFLAGFYQFVVVGAKLEEAVLKTFIGEDVLHIPFQFTGNDLTDERELLKFLVTADEVDNQFVYVPSMCWVVDGIDLHHIQLSKHIGPLDENCETYRALMADKFPFRPLNYRTGYPVWLSKVYLIDTFDFAADRDLDILTLYGNQLGSCTHPIRLHLDDEWGLNVKTDKVTEDTFARYITGKCFLRTELEKLPQFMVEYLRGMLDID